jgi:hypothetical protein
MYKLDLGWNLVCDNSAQWNIQRLWKAKFCLARTKMIMHRYGEKPKQHNKDKPPTNQPTNHNNHKQCARERMINKKKK